MLNLARALLRILLGFLMACLAAGLVLTLFVVTPSDLFAVPSDASLDRAGATALLWLLTATHCALFSAAFAAIAIAFGEWTEARSALFAVLTGLTIGILGFIAQFGSEASGQPTIFNSYALMAYAASGLTGGLVYWWASGRWSGLPDRRQTSSRQIPLPRITVAPARPKSPPSSDRV